MKVTAFVGSARRAHTFNAVKEFLEKLHSYGRVGLNQITIIQ